MSTTSIENLEAALKVAKLEKKFKEALDILKIQEPHFKDKFFCSHQLTRRSLAGRKKSTNMFLSAFKVLDIGIYQHVYSDERIKIEKVEDIKYPNADLDVYISMETIDISIENRGRVNIDFNPFIFSTPRQVHALRYEISEEKYNKIKNLVLERTDSLLYSDLFSKSLTKSELVFGYYGDSDCVKNLKNLGYNFVELDSSEVYTISNWHPFLYDGNKLMDSLESRAIIESRIKELIRQESNNTGFHYADQYISPTEVYRREMKRLENILSRLKK